MKTNIKLRLNFMETIEQLIKSLGYEGFRDLSLHTDNRWRVRSGIKIDGKRHMTHGNTPQTALKKMLDWYVNLPIQPAKLSDENKNTEV